MTALKGDEHSHCMAAFKDSSELQGPVMLCPFGSLNPAGRLIPWDISESAVPFEISRLQVPGMLDSRQD